MKALAMACLVALTVSACASQTRISDADKLQMYRANAGAPVPKFQYFGRIDGWTPLGDQALALWTKPSEVYLLEFKNTCVDLDFAQAITITNQFGQVYQNFDKVIVLGRSNTNMPCWIKEIRPVNAKAVKQAESEKRAAQVAERDKS